MTLFNYSIDITRLIEWPINKSIDNDECIYITQTFININILVLGVILLNV